MDVQERLRHTLILDCAVVALRITCLGCCCRWKAAGLDRLAVVPGSVALAAKGGGSTEVEVRCAFTLRPGVKAAVTEDAEEGGVGVGEVSTASYGTGACCLQCTECINVF